MNDVVAVVLAAGLGTRMKTETPKVLHEVGSRPILARVVSNLGQAGIKSIIAVVGYKGEVIKSSLKEKIKYVKQEELLGSGDALRRAAGTIEDFKGTVLVTCGDAPLILASTLTGLLNKHISGKASCTLLTCKMEDPFSYGRIVRGKNSGVLRIVEEKDASPDEKEIQEINVGTYCFNNSDLQKFIRDIEINKKKKEFYLTDIVDILVSNGKKVLTESCNPEESIGINSRRDIAMVNNIINKEVISKLMDSGVTVVDPNTTYVDEKAVIGKDTTIFPCTVIEKDVTIGIGCKIGPFTRIKEGAEIKDNTEVGSFIEVGKGQAD